jgi:hypothetical protein
MHTNSDGAEFTFSPLGGRKEGVAVGHVGNQREATCLMGHASKGRFIAPYERYARTVAGKFARNGGPNASTPTGDERNARLENRHDPLLYT